MADPASFLAILVRQPDGSVQELAADRVDEVDRLTDQPGSLVWVSATRPDEALIDVLGREFSLHPLALEDLRTQQQRPKVDTYESQHMVVAYEALADAPEGLAEIHIFIGSGWLLSVHWSHTPMLDGVRHRMAAGHNGGIDTAGELLYALLDAATDSYFPELDEVSDRIDAIEDRILEGEADRDGLAFRASASRASRRDCGAAGEPPGAGAGWDEKMSSQRGSSATAPILRPGR
jgi:magnesium transporter